MTFSGIVFFLSYICVAVAAFCIGLIVAHFELYDKLCDCGATIRYYLDLIEELGPSSEREVQSDNTESESGNSNE